MAREQQCCQHANQEGKRGVQTQSIQIARMRDLFGGDPIDDRAERAGNHDYGEQMAEQQALPNAERESHRAYPLSTAKSSSTRLARTCALP